MQLEWPGVYLGKPSLSREWWAEGLCWEATAAKRLLGLRALGRKGRAVGLCKPAIVAKRMLGLRALSRGGGGQKPA